MNTDEKTEKVNCFKCKHFTTSWEPKSPRACNLFGFKSASLPSVVVYKSTGIPCEGFEKKENREREQ